MSLREKINDDLKSSLKSGDKVTLDILRMVKAEVKTREVAVSAKTVLDDNGILDVINSFVKKAKESIRLYEEGGRSELADKEKAEMKVLEKYLPAQLSEDEVRAKVKEIAAKLGISDIKGMGQLMKGVMAEVGKSADGSLVSRIVKEVLGGK